MNQLKSTEILDKPKWAAGGFISNIVNSLISFKPLFSLMKVGARQTLISTAEKNGVPWRGRYAQLESIQNKLNKNFKNIQVLIFFILTLPLSFLLTSYF